VKHSTNLHICIVTVKLTRLLYIPYQMMTLLITMSDPYYQKSPFTFCVFLYISRMAETSLEMLYIG